MFIGSYQHSLDSKGRLSIPARFREELGQRFVVTKGLDECLFGFPLKEWAQQEQALRSLPLARGDARAFSRLFFSGAAEVEADAQGRVIIPPQLRAYARIERDVVVIGVSTRIEIWDAGAWENYRTKAEDSYEEIAEKVVTGLGG